MNVREKREWIKDSPREFNFTLIEMELWTKGSFHQWLSLSQFCFSIFHCFTSEFHADKLSKVEIHLKIVTLLCVITYTVKEYISRHCLSQSTLFQTLYTIMLRFVPNQSLSVKARGISEMRYTTLWTLIVYN